MKTGKNWELKFKGSRFTYIEQIQSIIIHYFKKCLINLEKVMEVKNGSASSTYRFGEWNFRYTSDPSRRVYSRLRYSPQTFFDGTRIDIEATIGLRATSSVAAEAAFLRSDVELPGGAFVADLALLRFDLALSPRMTLRTLSQYNSSTSGVSTSVRFNWIYSPGSDIYVAYDELRMDVPGVPWLRNRQLAVKMTYLVSR